MKKSTKLAFLLCGALGLTIAAWVGVRNESVASTATEDYARPVFRRLAAVRAKRKDQVTAYFDAAQESAESVLDDATIMNAFAALRRRDRALPPPDDLELDKHYVTHYGDFFDILFVDQTGYVFHTMRRESDYRSNLFEGPLCDTKLARTLPGVRRTTFVDYEFYPPSDEPAAFFAVPLPNREARNGQDAKTGLLGWIVLQCPLNKLNSICSDRRGLGRTGEVYLVNMDGRMVTDSRFRPDPAALALRVETEAVAEAVKVGAGEKILDDYRGVRVLSSFERFDVLGVPWVIIAEIDEAEAITEHYRKDPSLFQNRICRLLERRRIPPQSALPSNDHRKRVDMNEFTKVATGQVAVTNGVSSCTAIGAVLPNRFAYLAHIGPTDRLYGKPDLGHNDCLGRMLRRLRRFDIYPCELAELEFVVVAVHQESFGPAVERLLDLGVELAQIRFAYNPSVRYANVYLTPDRPPVWIEWITAAGKSTVMSGEAVLDLGAAVKQLVNLDRDRHAPQSAGMREANAYSPDPTSTFARPSS